MCAASRLVAALLALTALLTSQLAAAAEEPPGVVIYRGATVIDVRTGRELRGYAIVARGDRIVRVTPEAAISAKAMGDERDVGALEAGKLADIAFLARDPLVGVDAYKTVTLTVKRGVRFPRSDFHPAPSPDR
jgi:hypothetical protein